MSDEDDDDLFADSGEDTDDLIAASSQKPVAKPKKLTKKSAVNTNKRKRKIPDADNESDDDDDDDDDDDGPGLFDSDDDDEDELPARKKPPTKPLSKRERMEAMVRKKRQEQHQERVSRSKVERPSEPKAETADGYNSEDTYNSAEYVRTKEDMDFIDTEGDDADAVAELYAEQTFDDERGEAEEEPRKKKNKVSGAGSDRGRSELQALRADADADHPLMMVVNKMKSKKKVQKGIAELEEDGKAFLARMQQAADQDDEAIEQKRPALKKLAMLSEVCDVLAKRDMTRVLLDLDLLSICKRWVQPLPNGKLGNVTVRQRLLHAVSLMKGEGGINAHDLKRSEFGKVVMSLYMHKQETPKLKRQLKELIEQWSRPIFKKSGNMRDLEHVRDARGAGGLSQIARAQQMGKMRTTANPAKATHRGGKGQDLNSLIASGSKGKTESGINRVRVPFSQGFQYSVRPENRTAGVVDKRRQQVGLTADARGKLSKRMVEKGRTVSRNVRSANISIEGRSTKP